jgi:hypothetical protein
MEMELNKRRITFFRERERGAAYARKNKTKWKVVLAQQVDII